jgi:phage gp29-like protein
MKAPVTKPTMAASGARTMAQKVAALNRWREQYNPLRGLTLARAIALSESYFRGDMADLQWTYFFVEQTDADLLALLELRFGRLLEMDYNILTTEDADKKSAETQKQFLTERFNAIDNLYEAVEHLGLASFRGFSHCEKWYEGGELTHLEIVDQWNCVRDGLRGAWKYNPEARQTSFRALGADTLMPLENFLYREVRRPINRIALLKYVRSNLSEKDWDGYVEIYGIPGGVLIGPPTVPEGKEAEYEAAARDIAEGGSGYAPNGSDWKPNTAARGSQPFKERLDHLSEKLVLAGTAGKLTMLNGPTGLGGGQSDVHADVFDTIAAAEARRISEIFNKQLVAGWLEEKFPGQPQVAYFGLAANEETDVGEIVTQVKTLSDAGYQVDPGEVSEKSGYTVTLKAAPIAPPPPGAAMPPSPAAQVKNREEDALQAGLPAEAVAKVGRAIVFKAAAANQLTDAQRAIFRPIAERLAAIVAITDQAERDQALRRLRADLPALHAEVLRRAPELANVFERIIGTAMASGMAEHAQETASAKAKT